MRSFFLCCSGAGWAGGALACSGCRPLVLAGIAAQPLGPLLLALGLPVAALALLALAVHKGRW